MIYGVIVFLDVCSILLGKVGIDQFGVLFVVLLVVRAVISGCLCYLFLEKPLANILRRNKKIQDAQVAHV